MVELHGSFGNGKTPEASNKYDKSEYYARVCQVFENLPDADAKRSYCSAIIKCFDLKQGSPEEPIVIAEERGLNPHKIWQTRLVLPKRHAIKFFVEDVEWPGVSINDIKKVRIETYTKAFDREPFVRGKSTYWFSLAEWVVLLALSGEPPLPGALQKFSVDNNLI